MNKPLHHSFYILFLFSFIAIFKLGNAATITPLNDVCYNTVFVLANGSPSGGSYAGTGVSGGIFYAYLAGPGTHTITYTVNVNGIVSSASTTITVHPNPIPNINGNLNSCPDTTSKPKYYYSPKLDRCFNYSTGIYTVCEHSLDNFYTTNNVGSTYQWSSDIGTITGGQGTASAFFQWGAAVDTGYVKVIETNAYGCIGTTEICIIIKPIPAPNFNVNNSICLGTTSQFADLSSGATSWFWDFGDGTTSFSQNPTHTYSAGGTYTVTLTANSLCKCAATITKTITVNPTPGPQIICPSVVCGGGTSPYHTDANCSSYTWNVIGGSIVSGQNTDHILVDWGNGPTGTISLLTSGCNPATCSLATAYTVPVFSSNPTISGPTILCSAGSGTYSLPLWPGTTYSWSIVPSSAGTISSGDGSNIITVDWDGSPVNAQLVVNTSNPFINCQGSAALNVSVLDYFEITGNSTVCANSNLTLGTTFNGNFTWAVPSGATIISGQGTSSATTSWPTAGVYTVTATTTGSFCNSSQTYNITVVDPIVADSIIGSLYVCPGSSSSYTILSSNYYTNGTMYSWNVTNGTPITSSNYPINVTWGATGPYGLSVSQSPFGTSGCISPTYSISVKNILATSPSITGNDTVCLNTYNSYSVPSVAGATNYSWSISPANAGNITSGQGSKSIWVQFTSAGTFTINASVSVCGTTINVNYPVTVFPIPSPNIISSQNYVCPSASVTLSATSSFLTYQWQNGSLATISTSSTANITSSGTYILTVTDATGCPGKKNIYVPPAPAPIPTITTPGELNYCIGDPINTALYAPVAQGYSYQWYHNSNPAGNANNLVATSTGTYSIVVTNANGCIATYSISINSWGCGGGGAGCAPFCGAPCLPCPPSTDPTVGFQGNGVVWFKKPSGGKNNSPIALSTSTQIFCSDTVNFANTSGNSSYKWFWEFGDGDTSSLQNPIHVYPGPGYYNVIFRLFFNGGGFGELHKSIEIPVLSDFNYSVNCGTAYFTDFAINTPTSPITSRFWDFGDGTTSIAQNPSHYYTASGTYTVTYTVEAGGCTSVKTKTINVPPYPTANFSALTVCEGSPTPFTDASIGSTIQYWTWNFGDGTSSNLQNPLHTYTSGGTYTTTLIVTDYNWCTSTSVKTVTVGAAAAYAPIVASGPTTFCAGNTLSLTAPNASAYMWSTGATTQTISAIQSGFYSVWLSNGMGCQATVPTVTVVVNPQPTFYFSSSNTILCSGSNFNAYTFAYVSNCNYKWYKNGVFINGATNNFFQTTNAGNYYVQITNNNTGCAATSNTVTVINVPSPAAPTITGPASFCEGNSITLSANGNGGGSGQLSYRWSTGSTAQSITISNGGSYTYYVTDTNNCSANTTKTIIENPLPDLSLFPIGCRLKCESDTLYGPNGYASYTWKLNGNTISTAQDLITNTSGTYNLIVSTSFGCDDTSEDLNIDIPPLPAANAGINRIICPGDTLHLSGSGGLVYSWSPGNSLNNDSIANPIAQPNATLDYELTVTDINGCKDKDTMNVIVFCVVPVVEARDTVICVGTCATVAATCTTGIPPYTFVWSNGMTGAGPHSLCPSSTTSYTVTVTDSLGLSSSDTLTISFHPNFTLTTLSSNITCNGANDGSIDVNTLGGTAPFSYQWSTGATTDTTGHLLAAGTYSVIVSDFYTCSKNISDSITNPAPLNGIISFTNASCALSNGAVMITPNGGTSPYNYLWSNGASTSYINNVASGNYFVTITDLNNCVYSTSVAIGDSPRPQANFSADDTSGCETHCVTFTNTSPNTSANWDFGDGTTGSGNNINHCYPNAGIYSVLLTVTDNNGCTNDLQKNNHVEVFPSVGLTALTNDITCFGNNNGSATAIATNGTPNYQYTWLPLGSTSNSISGLAAGTYSISIVDAKGCFMDSVLTILEPPTLSVTLSNANSSCDLSNGSASAIITGGTAPHQYSWSNGSIQAAIVNLQSGVYTFTVIDANGCSDSSSVFIANIPPPIANFTANDTVGCATHCVTFTNNTPNTSAYWDFGDGNTGMGSPVTHCYQDSGLYDVKLIVTDNTTNCTDTLFKNNYILVHPTPIAAFIAQPQPASILNPIISFNNESVGGISFDWNFGDNSGSSDENPIHTYEDTGYYQTSLIVTNQYGCKDTVAQTIIINGEFVLFVPNAFTPNGDNTNNTFYPVMYGVEKFEWWIYDRWGQQIWHSTNPNTGWNGRVEGSDKEVQQDVYVWIIKLTDVFQLKHTYIGHVTVVK